MWLVRPIWVRKETEIRFKLKLQMWRLTSAIVFTTWTQKNFHALRVKVPGKKGKVKMNIDEKIDSLINAVAELTSKCDGTFQIVESMEKILENTAYSIHSFYNHK